MEYWMDKGNMVISNGRSHRSGLLYRYLLTEYGWKGIWVNKSLGEGIEVRLNFFEIQR